MGMGFDDLVAELLGAAEVGAKPGLPAREGRATVAVAKLKPNAVPDEALEPLARGGCHDRSQGLHKYRPLIDTDFRIESSIKR
jgi:hypothetical protein